MVVADGESSGKSGEVVLLPAFAQTRLGHQDNATPRRIAVKRRLNLFFAAAPCRSRVELKSQ
jgi:hypothetical protein